MAITQGVPQPGGPFGGINPPPTLAGKYYWPHFVTPSKALVLALTANTIYRTWIYVPKTTTFSGSWLYNTGTGDNGVVIREGVWDVNGVLKKDFGVITLTGAAAMRTAANSVTLSGPAWYQIGMVSSGTPTLACFTSAQFFSSVGYLPASNLANQLGSFPAAMFQAGGINSETPLGDSASFAYAAMPDPITTVTVTIMDAPGSATAGTFPAIGLYI